MSWILELKNVTKTFNGMKVLDDTNLKVREGEILALLGPSGAGKTTILKILAFIEKPSEGDIYFRGKRVTEKNMPQVRMESTMVFQKTILFNMSVFGNVAYGLKVRNVPNRRIDEEVSRALRLVGLQGFEKRHATELSGGEQQRVALARALVLNTRFIFLDEPTANLDPKNVSIMEEAIATISRESKTTIVMATHNMFQAKTLPDRIALMKDGRIMEVGTSTEIFGSLSKVLTSFAVLENTFKGTARVTESGTTLVDLGSGVQIEATVQSHGPVSVFVRPEDILVSTKPLESSARNAFYGHITEISDLGSIIRLKVDVGMVFAAQITKRSFERMQLNVGSEVFITFKSSSVQIV